MDLFKKVQQKEGVQINGLFLHFDKGKILICQHFKHSFLKLFLEGKVDSIILLKSTLLTSFH